MLRGTPGSPRTDTLCPFTTSFRSLGRDVGCMQGGDLARAATEESLASLEARRRRARAFGLDTSMIGPEAVRDLVPGIRGDFRGAMDTPSNGKADPARTTRAFYDPAQANGAEAVPAPGDDEIDGGSERASCRERVCAYG